MMQKAFNRVRLVLTELRDQEDKFLNAIAGKKKKPKTALYYLEMKNGSWQLWAKKEAGYPHMRIPDEVVYAADYGADSGVKSGTIHAEGNNWKWEIL